MHHTYDVIVAGAGPAGTTCARLCAREGLKTLLLDKDIFPRQKPCAGALSARTLDLLGCELPPDIIEKECYGVQVRCLDRSILVRKEKPLAVMVSRDRFDRFLADKAVECGVRFLMGEQVVDVVETEGGVTVATNKGRYETRFLVGADGIHSRVAHTLRQPLQKEQIVLATVCNSAAEESAIDLQLQDTIILDFGIAPMGYGWLFPHRGYFSIGIAGLASEFSEPREALSQYGSTLHVPVDSIHGHFIPLGGFRRPIAEGRILLAGDAAGFADPFHGEGIVYAILSGTLSASSILDSIRNSRKPAFAATRYIRACERLIRKPLRISLALARFLDRFPRLFIRIFFDNPSALERYIDISSGRTDYRHFARWLLVRLPFYLALSLLKESRRSRQSSLGQSRTENKGS